MGADLAGGEGEGDVDGGEEAVAHGVRPHGARQAACRVESGLGWGVGCGRMTGGILGRKSPAGASRKDRNWSGLAPARLSEGGTPIGWG